MNFQFLYFPKKQLFIDLSIALLVSILFVSSLILTIFPPIFLLLWIEFVVLVDNSDTLLDHLFDKFKIFDVGNKHYKLLTLFLLYPLLFVILSCHFVHFHEMFNFPFDLLGHIVHSEECCCLSVFAYFLKCLKFLIYSFIL